MILKLSKYRLSAPLIPLWFRNKPDADKLEEVSKIAVATNIPIIVVACYVGEEFGFNTALLDKIERLKTFYRVSGIEE